MNKLSFLTVFLLLCFSSYAQDQRIADSLKIVYKEDKLQGTEKLQLLSDLTYNELIDKNLSMAYVEELIAGAKEANNQKYLYNGYLQKGNKHMSLGDYEMALESFYLTAEIAIEQKNIENEGISNMAIADVYAGMDNFDNAERYYNKAIELLRESKDSIGIASALLNAGDTYFNNMEYDKALAYFEESGRIFNELNYAVGIAYNLGNVGMVYAEQGKDALAEKNMNEAILELEKTKDYYPISVYLTYMSDIYQRKGNFSQALKYANRSLDLAEKYGLKEQIRDANFKLSELYDFNGNFQASNANLKNYYIYRDSLLNLESIEHMADLRTDFEVSQKQTEVDLLREKQKNQRITVTAVIIALVLIIILAAGLFKRNRFIQKTSVLIEKEKDRSDNLLLNILPEETARELKDKGKVIPKKFDSVTVMFTDFRAFTKYSQYLTPELLVKSVDYHFSKFDTIMEKYGLEKIKTMGDAYMCAGGLPFPCEDHAEKMLQAAFEIIEFIDNIKNDEVRDISSFDIRIGIHTGPVVAGVVGIKKFAYDIWGDTVNIASRMESNSEPGRINVSEITYELIKDKFDCEFRGEIQAKNKGMMRMYFANGPKNQTIINLQSKKA